MPRELACSRWILLAALICPVPWAGADEPEARKSLPTRHDRLPRKVIVGTTMTHWYGNYPGLEGRLKQMRGLIDAMAEEAHAPGTAGRSTWCCSASAR